METRIIALDTWQPEIDEFVNEHHLRPDDRELVQQLIKETKSLPAPKGGYLCTPPRECTSGTVQLNACTFTSRLLSTHLKTQDLVFPFVASCGPELAAWVDAKTDMLENYLANAMAEDATHRVADQVRLDIESRYNMDNLSRMQPGSLPDWPLEEQQPLFEVLGSLPDKVQVTLTSSCLMLPTLSLSGIYFQDPEGFISCQLCTRARCPRRKAPFDPKRLARLQAE